MDILNLYFPQWQGSGSTPELYEGAQYIKENLLKEHPFTMVDVSTEEELSVEHHILGYAQILRQLKQAVQLLISNKPAKFFTIGGDCGIELAPISYLNKSYWHAFANFTGGRGNPAHLAMFLSSDSITSHLSRCSRFGSAGGEIHKRSRHASFHSQSIT